MYFSLLLIRFIIIGLFVYGTISQVLWPMYKGTSLFPAFNKRREKLNDEIQEANEDLEIMDLEDHLKDLKERKTAREKANPNHPPQE